MRTTMLYAARALFAVSVWAFAAACGDYGTVVVKQSSASGSGGSSIEASSANGSGGFGAAASSSTSSDAGGAMVSSSAASGGMGMGGMLPSTATSSTTTTASSSSGGGMCSQASDCGADASCVKFNCNAGKCEQLNTAKFTPCYVTPTKANADPGDGASCDGVGACAVWVAVSTANAPSARAFHTAIWTGSKMIVFGGLTKNGVTNTGYSYDPSSDVWTAISTNGAPAARHSHQTVWTGTKMIVWGGYGVAGYEMTGGIYDPATDSWSAMATANQPSLRQAHAMLYNGTYVLVWGGRSGSIAVNTGGRYHVATNTWTQGGLPTTNAPSKRFNMTAAMAPSSNAHPQGLMFIWGGTDTFDWFGDGAFYDVATNAWTKIDMSSGNQPLGGVPPKQKLESAGAFHQQGFTGFFIFGGWDGFDFYGTTLYQWDGAVEQPDGYWYSLKAGDPSAPQGRARFIGVVPGTGAFLWGGCYDAACAELHADGAVWKDDGAGGQWAKFPADPALSARSDATGVWTGTDVIIWGGNGAGGTLGTGARRAVYTDYLK